jgi:CDP-diacylglycerol--serine O-phosphatidyltransferase
MTRYRYISILPSLLTIGNFACGLLSVILCVQSSFAYGLGDAENIAKSHVLFESACLFVFIGMLFDLLDGRVARMTNSQSELGGQLDSLADMCNFGIAPAVVLATVWIRVMPGDTKWWSFSLVASTIYASCAMLRLAIYNLSISSEAKTNFSGLPSPGAAGTVIGAALFFSQSYVVEIWRKVYQFVFSDICDKIGIDRDYRAVAVYFFSAYVIIVGLLMVSKFRFAHVANIWLGKTKKVSVLIIMIAIISLLCMHRTRPIVIFIGFTAYIAICLFINIRNRIKKDSEEKIDHDLANLLNFDKENTDKPGDESSTAELKNEGQA